MKITRVLRLVTAALGLLLLASAPTAWAQSQFSNLPRNETLILENPEGTIKNAGWFNIWAINAGSQSNGLQQVGPRYASGTSTPNRGLDGVWQNSLAAEKPIYNADFTEMTVKLRHGHLLERRRRVHGGRRRPHGRRRRSSTRTCAGARVFTLNVGQVEAPDPYTVVFKLKKPNSRFHALFTVRWNAIWIMPKHVFEKVEDPLKFDFNKPVSLGAYVLHSYDPDGQWYIWQLRDDWQRTTLGRYRQAGPEIPRLHRSRPARQARDRADEPRARRDPRRRAGGHVHAGQAVEELAWPGSRASPTRHPDPTLPALIFNTQNDTVQEPGRALGAGAADRHQGGVDGVLPRRRHHLGDRHSADRDASRSSTTGRCRTGSRHSSSTPASARSSRTMPPSASRSPTCCGRPWATQIPTDPKTDCRFVRHGLVEDQSGGRDRAAGKGGLQASAASDWHTPDGKPFTVRVVVEGEFAPGHDARRLDDRRSSGGSSASTPRSMWRRVRC